MLRCLLQKEVMGTLLVVQWLRLHLPMQEVWVQPLVGDPHASWTKNKNKNKTKHKTEAVCDKFKKDFKKCSTSKNLKRGNYALRYSR